MTLGARRALAAAALLLALVIMSAMSATARAADPPPRITAPAAILVEPSSGQVVFSLAPDVPRPIASATKLMTALLALERLSLRDTLGAARYRAGPAETRLGLRPGERMRVSDLLRGLLLPSANDAAATLAEGVAGSRSAFVALMNRRARELGLSRTTFANPVGLDDPENRSTPRDLARLVLALRRNAFFRETVNRPRATLRSGDVPRTVINRNPLLREVPWVNGVKTGHTLAAGYVLVASGTRQGVTLVSVVLAAPSEAARAADSLALLRHGIALLRSVRVLGADRVLAHPRRRYFGDERVALVPGHALRAVIPRGTRARVVVRAPAVLSGPLRRGQRVGTVLVDLPRLKGPPRRVSVALVSARDVEKAGAVRRAGAYLSRTSTLVALLAILAGGGAWLTSARRAPNRRRGRRPPGAQNA